MSPVKRQVYLILLGVGALTLGAIVLATAHDWQEHLLAALGVLGGLAIIVVSLPGGDDK